MKKEYIMLLFIVFVFACSIKQMDKQEFQKITNDKSSKLDSFYLELYQQGKFNGTVLIAENGTIIYENAFGNANEAENQKLNINTKFELASVSKQFTAMGIVQLEKQGLLNYDDEISKYIPELSHYKGISIKNLLVHTGGLPDYMELADERWDKSKIADNQDIINLFELYKPEIIFQPNESYEYSNTGYMLLGTIIERVSRKSFGEFLNEKIFKPLGMTNTFVYRRRFAPRKVENYAIGYVFSDSLNQKVIPDSIESEEYVIYLDGIVGDGMLNSNVRDLLKWDRSLYEGKFIDDNDVRHIFSSYYTVDSTSTDYGFGWEIDSLMAYGKIVEHSGGWAGYVTHIERHLDNDKTIILLQNSLTENTEVPLKNTRRILYDIPIEKPIVLDSTLLKNYSGIYLSNSEKETKIKYKDGILFYPYPPNDPQINLELVPVSKFKFILDGFSPEVTYTFQTDEKGKVLNCRVQQIEQGIDRVLKRKE